MVWHEKGVRLLRIHKLQPPRREVSEAVAVQVAPLQASVHRLQGDRRGHGDMSHAKKFGMRFCSMHTNGEGVNKR